jgi:flagellar hook-length control protein FliK
MKAEAPQAPVNQETKNRKMSGTRHSAAREHGPGKYSALFQHLLSARAAVKNTGEGLAPPSDGTKGEISLASLLRPSRAGSLGTKIPELLPAEKPAPDAKSAGDRADSARKAAHAKDLAALAHAGHIAAGAEGGQKPAVSAKESKQESAEQSKAPVMEAHATQQRAEPVIRIVDLRRAEKAHASPDAPARDANAPSADRDFTAPVTLRTAGMREGLGETVSRPAPAASFHGQTPLERLREMAGSELVRASSLVLKDGGGEIRLVLKPESLGSVRIRMNMVDNAIEGRIIVDSSAVKNVVDGSLDALRRALTAEGFQMGSLQVSVGGQNTDGSARQQQEQETAAVRRNAAASFESSVPGLENVSLGDLFVNMFV